MKTRTIIIAGASLLAVGCIAYAFALSKGIAIFPIRILVSDQPVMTPGNGVWISALQRQVGSAEFTQIAKTNPVGRDFALGLFAHNGMTNHVRILIEHGADISDAAMEALMVSGPGLSNAVSLIRYVVAETAHTSSNQDGPANGSQPIRSETNRTSSSAGSRR